MTRTSDTPKKPRAKPRTMAKPKALQCTAFLRHLRRTGNVAMAAEAVGANPTTLWCRRRHHPDFAARWDAALVFARARLADSASAAAATEATGGAIRTQGGEYHVRVNRHGHRQICRAAAGRLSAAGERAFLHALSATANVRLAAQSVGIAISAIYERRYRSAAFEREMQEALRIGYETVELALLDHAMNGEDEAGDDPQAWMADLDVQSVDPFALMSPLQGINQLYLHRDAAAGKRGASGTHHKVTVEETDAVLTRWLDAFAMRDLRDRGVGKRPRKK